MLQPQRTQYILSVNILAFVLGETRHEIDIRAKAGLKGIKLKIGCGCRFF